MDRAIRHAVSFEQPVAVICGLRTEIQFDWVLARRAVIYNRGRGSGLNPPIPLIEDYVATLQDHRVKRVPHFQSLKALEAWAFEEVQTALKEYGLAGYVSEGPEETYQQFFPRTVKVTYPAALADGV